MEWYLWLLIGYAVLIFINTLVGYWVDNPRKKLKDVWLILFAFVVGLFVAPFLWLIAWYEKLIDSTVDYDTFTIHELTDDNKIALRNLGFQEDNFVSRNNIEYSGFRREYVVVQYNGRVFAQHEGGLSRKQKHLIEQIKNLPKPIDYDYEIEQLQNKIKDRKDSLKNWDKFYQQDIDKYNEKIKELKLKKEENNKQ